MNVLSIENLTKSYGERVLFADVTFGVDEGDKIGLIGVNGAGKSTFLKLVAGVEQADAGKVTKGSSVEVRYLPQNPEFDEAATVLEQVFNGYSPVMKVIRDYELALAEAQSQPQNRAAEQQLIRLSQQMDSHDAWQLESEAKAILMQLGIAEFSAPVGTLSGGQRKRVALASALINPCELLILDEPTNHIDNDTVAWLEQYLANRKGALLMITHDRYFLDRVTNRIIEIDKGKLYTYSGNYSKFLEAKAEREEQQEASERKRQNLLRNELAWMRRGARARSTKQKARIERFEELNSQSTDLNEAKLEISVASSRLGRKIIELENISHQFAAKTVIADFNYIVLKDDRVGIIGLNGSGKTTLLNIIAGRLVPDNGVVTTGQTVKVGYFSQENAQMDETMRVIEYIREEANSIATADGETISAAQMLERFLFPPQLQWMPIAKLSGGEKRRLYLLRILMSAPNVLLLDEPTNDLDIQTLTILEDYLDHFAGAVITVSHDRYFLDRVVDKLFVFTGNGQITQIPGGYSDYLAAKKPDTAPVAAVEKKKSSYEKPKEQLRKFTFKEQREFEQIDETIAEVEQALQQVSNAINSAGSNFELLEQLVKQQQELERSLEELLDRWTYLNEIAEEMK
ncbi:ATP-binding cassette subfamily F protein uup [Anaerospora hongkongensis]|uniref:ATP-binding cassette subfamily F protein uup n=1 Tax=Anaerospora hongkongensis TaxID=244830 RepID=A0A4R1PPB1_9FIRM|nr:ABC-F family ATP-binding cassette domain-containing protein [Anaerospora hongkongensis]TCL33239.1 ATP-binding cassette subfamily F protein uup [Anaerospora hongkongensis]